MDLLLGNIFYALAFILYLYVPHTKERHLILYLMLSASTLCGLGLYYQGELAGTYACIITNVFIITNAIVPKDKLDKTFKARLLILTIACLVFGFFSIKDLADVIPFVAMMGTRLVETLKCPLKIQRGYFVTLCIWASYVATTGNYFFLTLELLRIVNAAFGIWRTRKEQTAIEHPLWLLKPVIAFKSRAASRIL